MKIKFDVTIADIERAISKMQLVEYQARIGRVVPVALALQRVLKLKDKTDAISVGISAIFVSGFCIPMPLSMVRWSWKFDRHVRYGDYCEIVRPRSFEFDLPESYLQDGLELTDEFIKQILAD